MRKNEKNQEKKEEDEVKEKKREKNKHIWGVFLWPNTVSPIQLFEMRLKFQSKFYSYKGSCDVGAQ